MKRRMLVIALVALALAPAGAGLRPTDASASSKGSVVIVQAYPGTSFDVSVDGRKIRDDIDVGTVLAPLELAAGEHAVEFADTAGGDALATTVIVRSGSSSDVVVHRPASLRGSAVVTVYKTPRRPIGPGKARVLLAHTATVPPADVRVDGAVVFTNIANGEFAQAELPAGQHRVALLPTGATRSPILGPLDVELAPGTVTMVYAVGTPTNGSMNVVVHTARLSSDGSVLPDRIDTGSAGLAADIRGWTRMTRH